MDNYIFLKRQNLIFDKKGLRWCNKSTKFKNWQRTSKMPQILTMPFKVNHDNFFYYE